MFGKRLRPGVEKRRMGNCSMSARSAVVYERNEPDKRRQALAEAADDAAALAVFDRSGLPVLLRYRYFEYVGNNEEAFKTVAAAVGKTDRTWPATLYALGLYRRGETQKALAVLDSLGENQQGAFHQTMRMYMLAESRGGRQRAVETFSRCEGRYRGTARLFQAAVFCLLGEKDRGAAAFRRIREKPDVLPRLRTDSYLKLVDFNCGLISAEELLRSAAGSRYNLCNAHFFVGMARLCERDRRGAREHFQKCVALRVFDFDAADWSRTFLARMDAEPDWPGGT